MIYKFVCPIHLHTGNVLSPDLSHSIYLAINTCTHKFTDRESVTKVLNASAMGSMLTAFENRSSIEMEIRVSILPARPDRYLSIKKIPPGEIKELVTKSMCYKDTHDPENRTLLMVFMGSKFVFLHQFEVINNAKIICNIDDEGKLNVIKVKAKLFPGFRRIRFKLQILLYFAYHFFYL